ncbi:hypothetical protein BaRGS_00034510 [Batillaria attramentaria]|uniref:Transporter n=1 Tax=Batillaria attramentaria TaxID=370345 RepID=A0ABD0JH91_9CAEN
MAGESNLETGTMSSLQKGESGEGSGEKLHKREQWGRAFDFLLACIGFSVGLGNVWRFPYLCYKNGGGAFLIPYFLCVIFGGIPLFYLEVAVGQFMNRGGLQCWNLVPIFQGIGLASCIIVFFLNCYYNVILTWAFYYFFSSFTSELPWTGCDHDWNSDACAENFTGDANATKNLIDPVTEYWENKVLGISDGIDKMGTIKWDLALCLLLAWIVVYACICKGIRSSGKLGEMQRLTGRRFSRVSSSLRSWATWPRYRTARFRTSQSQFVGVEGVVTTIVDQYPRLLRKGYRKEIFIGFICIIMFFVGLSMVANGGMYVFQLFDYYSGSRIILLVAFFELIAISYIYGIKRFCDNIKMMLGDIWIVRTLPYMIICWTVLSPIFCMSIFVMSAINYSELDYQRPGSKGTYIYPDWAVGIGWALAATSAVWIPIVAIYKWVKNGATLEALKLLCRPYGLEAHQMRPQDFGERTLADLERERGVGDGAVVNYTVGDGKHGAVNVAFNGDSGKAPPPEGIFTKF